VAGKIEMSAGGINDVQRNIKKILNCRNSNTRREKQCLAELISRYLASGKELPDVVFDLLYSEKVRELSDMHWTPIATVIQALDFLPKENKLRILDVGSGVGKFCIVGALCSKHNFFGIEQRDYLVKEAESIKGIFPSARIVFRNGDALDYDWSKFDVLYFFNPFYLSNDPSERIDNSLPFGTRPFFQSVKKTKIRLKGVPIGTLVLTYYGYGSKMPPCFKLRKFQRCHSGELALWEKT